MAKLFDYKTQNGDFDYDKYVQIQTDGNKQKINLSWAQEQNIQFLAKYLKESLNTINKGACHGTRQGLEQKWFS
ncbi:MAG: tetratricopeptide repeat protein, partial [Bacteroidetes bacterium]|nr:tetratricopeptide repeat protein [Bacteroidota bacterium]